MKNNKGNKIGIVVFALTVLIFSIGFVFGLPGSRISSLDGKTNKRDSWHSAEVTIIDNQTLLKADHSVIYINWVNGSGIPSKLISNHPVGTIYVSVPSRNNTDDDNEYIFQKFVLKMVAQKGK